MSEHVSRIGLATEVVVGFLWGAVAGYLLVTLAVALLSTLLSTVGVPLLPAVVRLFDPTRALTGPVVLLACALFGAYWRYVYATVPEASLGAENAS